MKNYDYTSLYAILGFASFLLTLGIFSCLFCFFVSLPRLPKFIAVLCTWLLTYLADRLSIFAVSLPASLQVFFFSVCLSAARLYFPDYLPACLSVLFSDYLSVSLSCLENLHAIQVIAPSCPDTQTDLLCLPVSFFSVCLSASLPACLAVYLTGWLTDKLTDITNL